MKSLLIALCGLLPITAFAVNKEGQVFDSYIFWNTVDDPMNPYWDSTGKIIDAFEGGESGLRVTNGTTLRPELFHAGEGLEFDNTAQELRLSSDVAFKDWVETQMEAIELLEGPPGEKGDTGSQGIQGVKGDKGDAGSQGVQGIPGTNGTNGADGQGVNLTIAYPARTLNTAFQIDASRNAIVSYTVDVATSLSITAGATGTVTLQYADNAGMTTNLVNVQSSVNGNTGALTIGLSLTQTATASLTGVVPAGKYVRILTANTAGTPTFTYRAAQETKL